MIKYLLYIIIIRIFNIFYFLVNILISKRFSKKMKAKSSFAVLFCLINYFQTGHCGNSGTLRIGWHSYLSRWYRRAVGEMISTLFKLAWVFLKIGTFSFGGGIVMIPMIENEVVNNYGWLTKTEFIDAVTLGQITPGPVIVSASKSTVRTWPRT